MGVQKHPLQNRTNVQIKGGGVKGLLNNVQKNCTFLKGWHPLLPKVHAVLCSEQYRPLQLYCNHTDPREQWTNLHITVHCTLEMCSWWWCRWCNKSARWVFWNCCYHGGAPWWTMIRPWDTFARFRSSSFLISTFLPQHINLWQKN